MFFQPLNCRDLADWYPTAIWWPLVANTSTVDLVTKLPSPSCITTWSGLSWTIWSDCVSVQVRSAAGTLGSLTHSNDTEEPNTTDDTPDTVTEEGPTEIKSDFRQLLFC